MTRVRRRLIEDFLLPALNEQKYGGLLEWVDTSKNIFRIRWSHKNAAKWSLADTEVFQDWDKLKGHFKPDQKSYYMQAKQRFRAALYKLTTVEQLYSPDKHIKLYRLHLDIDKKQEALSRKMQRIAHKRENQTSIRTPVICKNTYGKGTELVGRDCAEEFNSSSNSSTFQSLSIKSEDCDQSQDLKIVFTPADYNEYQYALKRQRTQSNLRENHCPNLVKTERTSPDATVLRENPQMNMINKIPHVPIQAVPVYNNSAIRQVIEGSPKRVHATHIMYKRPIENSQPPLERPQASFPIKTQVDPQLEAEIIKFLSDNSRKGVVEHGYIHNENNDLKSKMYPDGVQNHMYGNPDSVQSLNRQNTDGVQDNKHPSPDSTQIYKHHNPDGVQDNKHLSPDSTQNYKHHNPDGVLNLCTKSENKQVLAR